MTTWIDLHGISLAEGDSLTWLHAMPVGKKKHPVFGTLDFSAGRLKNFADSVNNRVRRIDPVVDYEHRMDPSKGHRAAGWIKGAEVRNNGLYLGVQFTDEAKQEIKNGHYRYVSPELRNEWEDEDGKKHKDVIVATALTNRPFLKSLDEFSIAASEDFIDTLRPRKGNSMPEWLRNLLGLSENATEDEAQRKLGELAFTNRPPVGPGAPGTGTTPQPQATNSGIDTSALNGDMRVLAESFNQQFSELRKQVGEQQRASLLGNLMNQQFAEIQNLLQTSQEQTRTAQATALTEQLTNSNGKRYALPATIQDRLRNQLLSESPDKVELKDVIAMFTELTEKGLVPLGEQTTNNPTTGEEQQPAAQGATTGDPQGELFKFAEEIQKADPKLSDVDAWEQAVVAHPELYNKAYRNAAFIEGAVR